MEFAKVVPRHPATFSVQLAPLLSSLIHSTPHPRGPVLDPMAGIGRHHLATHYNELEPEWAAQCPGPNVTIADARHLPYPSNTFPVVITSPVYGNRMSDHHNARDDSTRNTYRHTLGRPLHRYNTGQLQWNTGNHLGNTYKSLHEEIWREVLRVLMPGGVFILNVKDHYRKYVLQPVTHWHDSFLRSLGLSKMISRYVSTPGNRYGENGELRVDGESVIVYGKSAELFT